MSRQAFLSAYACVVAAVLFVAGCGRSDVGLLDVDGGPPGGACKSNADCASSPATPICDVPSGVCVECEPSPDNCPSGKICDGGTHKCIPGCRGDGDCASPTPHCRTDVHTCVECTSNAQCPSGDICKDFRCVGFCGPGGSCPSGLACCDPFCVDEKSDPANCGGCGVNCGPYAHGTPSCTGSACSIGRCDIGFADCDGRVSDGCEVNVDADPANCGACGRACPIGDTCSGGACVGGCGPSGACPAGLACCGASCADTASDPLNCGGCGIACATPPHATSSCSASACAISDCSPGFADCNGVFADGCEVDLAADPTHCGTCSTACPPGATCTGGLCAGRCGSAGCGPGLSCCGALCKNVFSDADNCGGCGNVCPPVANGSRACASSKCKIGSCNAGFADCNALVSDGCEVNVGGDVGNCGACGHPCAPGQVCSAGVCTGGGCRATGCPGALTCCGDKCVDLKSDPLNCAGCFTACSADTPTCKDGACCKIDPSGGICGGIACTGGLTICASKCVDEQNDPANCGGCRFACAPGETCKVGKCTPSGCGGGPSCAPGATCCPDGCQSTGSDPFHCGGCSVRCPTPPNTTPTCAGGACGFACASGFTDCDKIPTNGCEANTDTDPRNCGGCGVACAAGSKCSAGKCTSTCACTAPEVCCGGGTTCINPTADPKNCGGCGTACPTRANSIPTCSGSACGIACAGSFLDCNKSATDGCEIDSSSDAANCGGCGKACATGTTCVGGVCGGASEGAFDPIVNPTFLSPGVHHFTTITVPAGVVVFVAGSGSNSGTLDLRATGAIRIDGTIDVSGGPGSQNTITSRSTNEGRVGSGGYTGELKTSPFSPACKFVDGIPGPNGEGPSGTIGSCPAGPSACIDETSPLSLLFAAPPAKFGGGAGVFTGYRAYGSGGGGPAGGAPGALGAAYPGESDCSGASAGGGATSGTGGKATGKPYDGADGSLGQTQCAGLRPGVPPAFVGGGGGGSIGITASSDLPVTATFQVGSGGGGGSADYLNRPVFGGTSGGGGGGGALRLSTPATIVINGELLANGGDGGDAFIGNGSAAGCDPQPGAAGGGGSGGVIYVQAPSITVGSSAKISAAGGQGGFASIFASGGGGGTGGLGRIRLSVTPATCSLSGTFDPPLASSCAPTATPVAGRAYVGVYPG